MKSAEIRETFLKFFEKHGHTRVPSASLIPVGDPTLYFTNAGMVPFKDVFLGNESRAYKRAASSQKCMRVSGKHNDLENVGYTPRHHTFFEMLGNFSFGDYFKEEAIEFAWEFLTKVLKLPADRMVVTVFEKDDEAFKLWEAHVPKNRIFRMTEKDNFWAMGETGPCGPCSEILWDFGAGAFTKKEVESDRFFELWNLVFMQFNRDASGNLNPLPKPSVDTGMGLERLACVMQNKKSNWEADLFTPIIETIQKIIGTASHSLAVTDREVAIRVIADHVRAATFLIADGLFPSNDGRGYVLRRILRRAVRYGRQLGMHQPFFAKVAETVVQEMSGAYPEIKKQKSVVEKVLTNEEERFLETLERGLEILEKEFAVLEKSKTKMVPGETVFKLYDTFGFPKDLTDLIARERQFSADEAGFEKAMEAQRERARKSWRGTAAKAVTPVLQTIYKKGDRTHFFYDRLTCEKESPLHLLREGKEVEAVEPGEEFDLIVAKTPFYAEGGGQVGDTGWIYLSGGEAHILDTQKPYPDLFVHHGKVAAGELTLKDDLKLVVDAERRQKIMNNHTATHLLHAALRQILGEHVKQAGSYLDDHYLRFDFSHFSAITDEQLADIEAFINKIVQKNILLRTQTLPYREAIAKGAFAYFGEKYGEVVRMVEIRGFSIELCGGTHTEKTGDIGPVRLIKERSVASGVRRIEAVSGEAAGHFEKEHALKIKEEKEAGKEKLAKQEKEKKEKSSRLQTVLVEDLSPYIKEVKGAKIFAREVEAADIAELREIADLLKQKLKSGVVIVGAAIGGKASLVVMVTPDCTQKFHAGEIVKKLAAAVGGTGGGRPEMAQGGGPDVGSLPSALQQARNLL